MTKNPNNKTGTTKKKTSAKSTTSTKSSSSRATKGTATLKSTSTLSGNSTNTNNTATKAGRRHLEANTLSKGAKSSMAVRLISAFVGILIVGPALFLGDWIYFALLTIALAFACWEILGCANKRTPLIFIIYFIFVAAITYWPIFRTLLIDGLKMGKIDDYFTSIYLSIIVIMIGFFFLFLLTVIYKDFSVVDACFLITMAVLIGFGFQCLFYLRYVPFTLLGLESGLFEFNFDNTVRASMLLVFVVTGTFVTDAGAYFVGVFFGKNKMNERISPKKTWEGFVGGIIISFIVTATIGICFAASGNPILPDLLDLNHWYYILILALLIPLFATLGDFVFSSIKRYWGIKDYGKLIPGHGGVLDRLDSIFFATIISAIFIFMLSNISGGTLNWSSFLV